MNNDRTPELLSPAGNWDCARAAVVSGADAIYFGLPRFNARMRADNFTEDDLPELMQYLHQYGVKGFVAMNTLIFTSELESAAEQLEKMQAAGVDGVIVQDLGLAKLVNEIAPDIELHASTQMTLTSPEGLEFAKEVFSLDRAVLARELSLKEFEKFKPEENVPIEVFVHGALCVAYSGQCLTSESLGQRSANRGECAQACRMPYELIVDGEVTHLEEAQYLLSPQDLAAVDLVPDLVKMGIVSYKIEGRLKSPEYVAAVTKVYRRALDDAIANTPSPATEEERYRLEMTFSRGLTNGWMEGTNHPKLTHGKWGKKRGPYVGKIIDIGEGWVELDSQPEANLKKGDGVVIDNGGDRNKEQGGTVWSVRGTRIIFDKFASINFDRVYSDNLLWKTSDKQLQKEINTEWRSARPDTVKDNGLKVSVEGKVDTPLTLKCGQITIESSAQLQEAKSAGLTKESVFLQLDKFGDAPFFIEEFSFNLPGNLYLAKSELNKLRRTLASKLEEKNSPQKGKTLSDVTNSFKSVFKANQKSDSNGSLNILCRSLEQIEACLECGIETIYADFEEIREFPKAVELVRSNENPNVQIYLATPRIQKAGEQGYFKYIERCAPDGVLIRNLGAIHYFKKSALKKIGDFSLNVANPLTAEILMEQGDFENLTVSYDLNTEQVLDLAKNCPSSWFEVSVHQHMPMFHMEHCVFCTFMSEGTTYKDCGRPCEKHEVQLRDRVGQLHTLKADVGCRNTLFNGRAQTAARHMEDFQTVGIHKFRIELLNESKDSAQLIIQRYLDKLADKTTADELIAEFGILDRLGVTEGTLAKKRDEVHS